MNYLQALRLLHNQLCPRSYVEIGCRKGFSLSLSKCNSIAIDPDFEIINELSAPTRIYKKTSDDFFAEHSLIEVLGSPFDLAFIDGMHLAEYALRDFMNLERAASPESLIVIDDTLPEKIEWAGRERKSNIWTGDVYKLIMILKEYRPDLEINVFDIEMKGLAIIRNLKPGDSILHDSLPEIEQNILAGSYTRESAKEIRDIVKPLNPEGLQHYLGSLSPFASDRVRSAYELKNNYLELLKKSLLNEIYLDDELRLLYLRDCLEGKRTFHYEVFHDVRNTMPEEYAQLLESRREGRFPERDIHRSGFSHTMIGRKRLENLHAILDCIRKENIQGDLIECGVWRGGSCIFMAGYLKYYHMQDRSIYVADSFEGLPVPSRQEDEKMDLSKEKYPELAVSLEAVQQNFQAYDLLHENVRFLKGWFKDTLPSYSGGTIALLRLDGDLYESTMDALSALYEKVSPGGVIVIDDFALPNCKQAVKDYFEQNNAQLPDMNEVDWTGVWWRKHG